MKEAVYQPQHWHYCQFKPTMSTCDTAVRWQCSLVLTYLYLLTYLIIIIIIILTPEVSAK